MKILRILPLVFLATVSVLAQPAAKAKPEAASLYPIRDGFVDAHGVLIYYWEIGRGAPLMAALHHRLAHT